MIAAATIAALNQHLVSTDLLPRTAASSLDETITAAVSQPPASRAAPPALTKAVPDSSNLAQTLTSALAFYVSNPPSDEQYSYEGISSHSSSPRNNTTFVVSVLRRCKPSTVRSTRAASHEFSCCNFRPHG